MEKQKNVILRERGVVGKRTEFRALRESEQKAIELLGLGGEDSSADWLWPQIRWSNLF